MNETLIPQGFKPALQTIRWIAPFLPRPLETRLLSNTAPGTLVLFHYTEEALQEWQNFDYEWELEEIEISESSSPVPTSEATLPRTGW